MTGFGYNINGFGVAGLQPADGGQQVYTGAGTYSWVAPDAVQSVCVVVVGASSNVSSWNTAGGALAWKNDIPVVAGNSYEVKISHSAGVWNYFINNSTVAVQVSSVKESSGTRVGDGGGDGGAWGNSSGGGAGGGGAGGYSGDGGDGGGGSGGGTGGGGGGVGLLGEGTSGAGGGNGSDGSGGGGGGGAFANSSGGGAGGSGGAAATSNHGGAYGGGAGWSGTQGPAAVRIIWGSLRAFPATRTEDQ